MKTSDPNQTYMDITSNVDRLTEAEKAHILRATDFTYVYGVGLIFLSNGSWGCTDSVAALAFLRQHNIYEVK